MRLIQFLSAVNLFEAAKDRYIQMFTNLNPMFKEIGKEYEYDTEVMEAIQWAMRTLKKQDKVIWYLRLVKLEILIRMAVNSESKIGELFERAFRKMADQFSKKMGTTPKKATEAAQDVSTSNIILKRPVVTASFSFSIIL